MAIDTAQKRVSALRMTLPLPDGTIDQGDRQHITWNYAGILAGELELPEPVWTFSAHRRPFVFLAQARGIQT